MWPAVLVLGMSFPLWMGWRRCAGTTLRHALVWAAFAWMAWFAYAVEPSQLTGYAALTLTAAAGVAVLGARRPGVVAWNFIVLSLLVVLWLGWAEGQLLGSGVKLGPVRLAFLAALLAITVVNYVPTRSAGGIIALGLACAGVSEHLRTGSCSPAWLPPLLAGLSPWLAWAGQWVSTGGSDFDHRWQQFRDRFGVIWAARLAEQFNRAATNAGWPVRLDWNGLRPPTDPVPAEWAAALTALQKRFTTD